MKTTLIIHLIVISLLAGFFVGQTGAPEPQAKISSETEDSVSSNHDYLRDEL